MKIRSLLTILAIGMASVLTVGSVKSADITAEHSVLYCVSSTNDGSTIVYDGYKKAAVASDVVVSDKTGKSIDSLEKLSSAIGTAPNWDKAQIGDQVGNELGDALYADIQIKDDKVVSIEVVDSKTRPVVGIAWMGTDKVSSADRVIAASILRHGGKAVLLRKSTNEKDCEESLKDLDGFFMPGGADVDPQLYGEEPYPHGSVDIGKVRDTSDVLTCRWVIEHNLPAIWVCRGEQVLNVALGGALIQDIPSYQGIRVQNGEFDSSNVEVIKDEGLAGNPCVPTHYRVRIDGIAHHGRHSLGDEKNPGISADSKFLLPIIGKRYYPSIFSSHHQAIDPKRVGKGLTIVATSPDGIVEAVEYQANDFALATQLHFEYDTDSADPEIARYSNSYFGYFIDAIRKHAEKIGK